MKNSFFVFGGTVLLLLCLLSCAGNRAPVIEDGEQQVKGAVVKRKEAPNEIEGFGTLSFQKKFDVASAQEAVVEKLYFREGAEVEAGAVMARLSNPQIALAAGRAQNMLSQAEAALALSRTQLLEGENQAEAALLSLEKAEAELEQARKDYKELERKQKGEERLFRAGGLPQETIYSSRFAIEKEAERIRLSEKELEIKKIGFRDKDLINAGFRVPENKADRDAAFIKLSTEKLRLEHSAAVARLEASRKELRSGALSEEDLLVKSPASGIIASRYYEEGERVKPEDKLFTIIDTESLYALFPVSETEAFRIEKGMKAAVTLDGTGKSYNGTVDLVSPTADSSSFTFSVRIILSERDAIALASNVTVLSAAAAPAFDGKEAARPGMFARITVHIGEAGSVLTVDDKTIINRKDDEGVCFIVSGNRVQARNVKLGKLTGEEREVISGLNEGEIVVSRPPATLQEGAYVKLVE